MNSAERHKALAKPFPREKIQQKRGQGGRMMSYISHGLITERLNEVDPDWSSEVIEVFTYTDAAGVLHCAGVTLALTVGGITRHEAGGPQRPTIFADEIKNALSDALKRAAMRFGVALEMWEELIDAEYDEDVTLAEQTPVQRQSAPPRQQQAGPASNGQEQRPQASSSQLISEKQIPFLWKLAGEKGKDDEDMHAHIRQHYHKESVKDLTRKEASEVIDWLQSLGAAPQSIKQEPQRGYAQGATLAGVPEEPAHLRGDWDRDTR